MSGFLGHNGVGAAYFLDSFMRAYNSAEDRRLRRKGLDFQQKRQGMLDDITQQRWAMQQDAASKQSIQNEQNAMIAANPGLLSQVGQSQARPTDDFHGPMPVFMPSADAIYKAREISNSNSPKFEYKGDRWWEVGTEGPPKAVTDKPIAKPSASDIVITEVDGKRVAYNKITGATKELGPVKENSGPTAPISANLTPVEKKFDEQAGKDLVEFVVGGGFADVDKNIAQLEDVATLLETRDDITGPVIGNTPDFALKMMNPTALDARERVEEVVQRNLRLILGAQFTEKEGTRLIERAFNPGLDEKVNLKRVRDLIGSIKRAAESKRAAYKYIQKHGTLKGFSGDLYTSIADIERGADAKGEADRLIQKYGSQ